MTTNTATSPVQQALAAVLSLSLRDYFVFAGLLSDAIEGDERTTAYLDLFNNVDRRAWHQMMAGAYSCMDTVEAAAGSEQCESCGEWRPIPEHWQKPQPEAA